jgi:hypothetical protein
MWTRFSMVTMGWANGAENMQLPAIHAASNAPSMRCRCGSNSLSAASLSAPQKGSPHRSVVAEIVQVAPAVVLWWHVIGMLNQHHERESRFVHIHPIGAHQRAIEREDQAVRTVSLPPPTGQHTTPHQRPTTRSPSQATRCAARTTASTAGARALLGYGVGRGPCHQARSNRRWASGCWNAPWPPVWSRLQAVYNLSILNWI